MPKAFYAHIFLDNRLVMRRAMSEVPRVGDCIRLGDGKYAKVAEVVWCFDETTAFAEERINIGLKTEKENEDS